MAISFDQFLKKAGGTSKDVRIDESILPESSNTGFLSNVSSSIKNRGANVVEQLNNPNGQNPILSGIKATGEAFGAIGDVVGAGAKAIAPNLTKKIGDTFSEAISHASNYQNPKTGKTLGEELLQLQERDPNLGGAVEQILQGLQGTGDIANNILVAQGGKLTAQKGVDLTKKVPTPTLNQAGELFKGAGEKVTGVVTKMEEPVKIALQSYEANQPSLFQRVKNFATGVESPKPIGNKPITEANTAVRLLEPGTEWQIGVDARRVSGKIWNDLIQPALNASEDFVGKNGFFETLRNRIIAENKDLGRRNTLLNAFENFQDDFKHVANFKLPKLQEYKEGWAKFVPEKAYKGEPIAGALNEVRKLAAQEARKIIYENLGGKVKQAYIDYGNLQSIVEAGIKSVEGLTDKSFTRKIYEFVIDKAVTPVATVAGKVLYKTGDGLEFIGNGGAKKVKDVIVNSQTRGTFPVKIEKPKELKVKSGSENKIKVNTPRTKEAEYLKSQGIEPYSKNLPTIK